MGYDANSLEVYKITGVRHPLYPRKHAMRKKKVGVGETSDPMVRVFLFPFLHVSEIA